MGAGRPRPRCALRLGYHKHNVHPALRWITNQYEYNKEQTKSQHSLHDE